METGKFTFTARSVPACEDFLLIKKSGGQYSKIDKFIAENPQTTRETLNQCDLLYRGKEQKYTDYTVDYVAFSNRLKLLKFNGWRIIVSPTIRAALYFTEKTCDCLQNARYFALKSNLIIDSNENIHWSHGYVAQYSLRCIYFGTAATWYSNTFDQLLQSVYWAYELYTAATDRNGDRYDGTWDAKKTMSSCTYEFVARELKQRNLTKVRKMLTKCFGKIEEVRSWANYIKHKGGIEYLYLEPEPPFKIYIAPAGEEGATIPDDRFEIQNFKSPIEVDIDEKITVIEQAHCALFECITSVIEEIDFDKYQLK